VRVSLDVRHMSDYYRFRFGMQKGWTPEFGNELAAPAGIFGVAHVVAVIFCCYYNYPYRISTVPSPIVISIALATFLLFLAYVTDSHKRTGLLIFTFACVVVVLCIFPYVYVLDEQNIAFEEFRQLDTWRAYGIGVSSIGYMAILLWQCVARLKM